MSGAQDPLAIVAEQLGVRLPRHLLAIINEYINALPVVAAHAVQIDAKAYLVYWLSGSSLVSITCGDVEQTDR